jgi:chemotaxis signal transduction protein
MNPSGPSAAAGRAGPAPPRWEALARAAAGPEAQAQEARLRELLLLGLRGDLYALPVDRVREVVRMRPITPLPRAASRVCGVIALRGEIIQILDLWRCVGLGPEGRAWGCEPHGPPPSEPLPNEAPSPRLAGASATPGRVAARRRIVVLRDLVAPQTGLLVDQALEVWRVGEEALRPVTRRETDAVAALCLRGERLVSLLDIDRVLDLDPGGSRGGGGA